MQKSHIIVGLGIFALASAAIVARSRAVTEADPEPQLTEWEQPTDWSFESAAIWAQNTTEQLMGTNTNANNASALLEAIAWAEGTAKQTNPYAVCYGYKFTIKNFADHPAVLGDWRGEKLSDAMCAGAGLGPGCVSTAAGKYQILGPTWVEIKRKLGLKDFGPASQDAAGTEILRQAGALTAINNGQFVQAIRLAKKKWASLPGAGYGQPERKLADLRKRFTDAGGVLA